MAGPPRLSPQDAATMAFMGLSPDLVSAPKPLELWAENASAVALFQAVCTQWRMGPGGAIGLDYAVLPLVLRQLALRGRAAREAFAGLQTMEAEALAWLEQQRAQQRQR